MNCEDRITSKLLSLRYRSNPIKSKELEEEFNISSSQVRDVVRSLREKGVPITSGAEGYWFARNIEELKPTLNHLKERALSLLRTISKLEKNFVNPSGNPDLFGRSVIDEIIEDIKNKE